MIKSTPPSSSMRTTGRGSGRRSRLLTLIGLPLVVVGLGLAVYSIATTPKTIPGRPPLRAFDAETVGRLEQRAWAAYYYRQWPQLFDLLLRLSRGQFGLSLLQAVYASYVGTQAQVVFARQGDRDGLAEEYMRRFYEFVREPTGARYDPRRAAALEVRWWVVHRQRDQYPDHSALTAALAATYAEVYQLPAERLIAAAEARAAAMDLSDQWNREGKTPDSPLLAQISDLLVASYRALSEADSSAVRSRRGMIAACRLLTTADALQHLQQAGGLGVEEYLLFDRLAAGQAAISRRRAASSIRRESRRPTSSVVVAR